MKRKIKNIKFKVALSMERIGDTNGRNIRSLCTLRSPCLNTKSWCSSRKKSIPYIPKCSLITLKTPWLLYSQPQYQYIACILGQWLCASCVVSSLLSINIVISNLTPAYNAGVKYTQTIFTIRLSISLSNTSTSQTSLTSSNSADSLKSWEREKVGGMSLS